MSPRTTSGSRPRRRAHQDDEAALLLAVLTSLSDAVDAEPALVETIGIVSRWLGAMVGELWLADEAGSALDLQHSWTVPGVDGLAFDSAGRQSPLSPGEGVVGTVWTSGDLIAAALEDSADTARTTAARSLGIDSTLAVPVAVGDACDGVLAFHFAGPAPAAAIVEPVLGKVARHLGRFLFRMAEIAEARRAVEDMNALAATDALTGLRNRREFDRAMKAIPRGPFAILSVDVDQLKATNDQYGHAAGDALICAIAATLEPLLRGSDVLARVGGDEFAAILCGVDAARAAAVAERFRAAVHRTVLPTGAPHVSIGWSAAGAGSDPLAALEAADRCLYEAKGSGGDCVRGTELARAWTTSSAPASSIDLLSVVLLRRTIETVFQPIVDLVDGSVFGYEALARPPGTGATDSVEDLFDAARRTGSLAELDLLCRRLAIREAGALPVSPLLFLNISSSMLLTPAHGLAQLMRMLGRAGRSPESTVLEISEREHIRDLERLMRIVETYRREGLRFAVDDMGEGHTTFELVAASGAEYLKIGRSLTATVTRMDSRAAMTAAATYARAAGAMVIAEGVEDDVTRDAVAGLGIRLGQGFRLGEPAAAGALEHEVVGRRRPAGAVERQWGTRAGMRTLRG